MKRFLIILLFLPSYTNAQDHIPDESDTYMSDSLNRLYIVGLQSLNNGDIVQAEISFRSILAFPFRSQEWRTTRYYKGKAHFYLGDIYFIKKQFDKSADNYRQVVYEYGEIEEYSSALFKLGRSFILNKQEKEGIQILQDYIYNYGSETGFTDNALYWIANGYLYLKDHLSALKTLRQILRDFPNSPMAYDVRLLVSELKTTDPVVPQKEQQALQASLTDINTKVVNLEKEQELITRINGLLNLKEKLLLIKERKLDLLDRVGKARVNAIKAQTSSIDGILTLE